MPGWAFVWKNDMSDGHIVVYGDDCTPYAEKQNRFLRPARTDARFLAHLVAIRSNAAQHRVRNRTLPELGAAAYRLSQAKPPQNTPIYKNISA